MRNRGRWALVIGTIGLLGCVVGTVQLWFYGTVSIRPGRDPTSGKAAVELLLVLLAVSTAFIAYGSFMLRRARRFSGK